MSDVTIRAAQPVEIDRLLDLMRELYAADHMAFVEARARAALAALIGDLTRGWVLVAADGDTVVGYAVVTRGYSLEFGGAFALLDELFVVDEARRRGIGAAIVRAAVARCRAEGVQAVRLEVERANDGARRLYERLGFAAHDRDLMTHRL
jgi:ribosomal protein S18 acetylase RimI-like enzyme